MKKFFFVAALAAAVLSSCSKNDVESVAVVDDNAIAFEAYTTVAATKGTVVAPASFTSVGVFAFYQPAVNGTAQNFSTIKFPTPDFMYNQKVAVADGSYSPVKYWPNNPNDQVSFFAYAPYDASTAWEDLGIKTNSLGADLTVNFPIYESVKDQVDYLWAAPQLNLSKQPVEDQVDGEGNVTKDGKVRFNFAHITSQLSLEIGVEQDEANQAPTAWEDENTDITVNSVTFKGLATNLVYKGGALTPSGSQDIVLTPENFVGGSCVIEDGWATGFHQLTANDSYMFLAPGTLGKVVVNYTVSTEDTPNPANSSVITNNIEATLSKTLEAGKAYKLQLLIGMTSVKFEVKASDWVAETDEQVDVPANQPEPIVP